MQYRVLGSTGLSVSVVGMGTWQFGGEWGMTFTQQQVDAIVDEARAVGVNLIDTAECYGDHLSEAMIGKAIRPDREKWIVATKFGHKFNAPFDRDQVWQLSDVQQQLDDSLRALQTDYIDLYQFHSGKDEVFDNDALWDWLNTQKRAGKIRHLGISIGSNDNLYQTDAATRVGAEAIQVVYNRLDKTPEQRVFDSCLRQNLGVLARVPLASGFLSGKYQVGHQFDAGDVRSQWRTEDQRRQQIEQAIAIGQQEVPPGVPMARWALAWCLKHPAVTSVIPGCKTPQQLRDNAAAADLTDMVRADHPQAVAQP